MNYIPTPDNPLITLTNLGYYENSIDERLKTKVNSEEGKGLSQNDFTDALKAQIGANQQAISTLTETVNSLKEKVEAMPSAEDLAKVYRYKGSVDTVSELDQKEKVVGDTYNVTENGVNYAWDGDQWDSLAGIVDYSELTGRVESLETALEGVDSSLAQIASDLEGLA